jgi:hypothetical protein
VLFFINIMKFRFRKRFFTSLALSDIFVPSVKLPCVFWRARYGHAVLVLELKPLSTVNANLSIIVHAST